MFYFQELHLLYNIRGENAWLTQAIIEKDNNQSEMIKPFPTRHIRAVLEDFPIEGDTERLKKNRKRRESDSKKSDTNEMTSQDDSRNLDINPWPSAWLIRETYEYFIQHQRLDESEQYLRTLGGNIPLSMMVPTLDSHGYFYRTRFGDGCNCQGREES